MAKKYIDNLLKVKADIESVPLKYTKDYANIAAQTQGSTLASDGTLTVNTAFHGISIQDGKKYLLVVLYKSAIYSIIRAVNTNGSGYVDNLETNIYHDAGSIKKFLFTAEAGSRGFLGFQQNGNNNYPQSLWKVALFDVSNLDDEEIDELVNADLSAVFGVSNPKVNIDTLTPTVQQILFSVFSGLELCAMGDSMSTLYTYFDYLKNKLGIVSTGTQIGGTRVSGAASDSFWQNSRVNAMSASAKALVIYGGTNDAPYTILGDVVRTNYDTNTFVGAYNVLLSKLYYRYLKQDVGYYDGNIDYSGVNQIANPLNQIPIIVVAPPQMPNAANNAKLKDLHDCLLQIAEMWSLPVIDCFASMQFNAMVNKVDDVHLAIGFHNNLAGMLYTKMLELQATFESQAYKTVSHTITVNNTSGLTVNVHSPAYEGDVVSIIIDTTTSPTVSATAGGNAVTITELGLYGSPQKHYYSFIMPTAAVTLTISA